MKILQCVVSVSGDGCSLRVLSPACVWHTRRILAADNCYTHSLEQVNGSQVLNDKRVSAIVYCAVGMWAKLIFRFMDRKYA